MSHAEVVSTRKRSISREVSNGMLAWEGLRLSYITLEVEKHLFGAFLPCAGAGVRFRALSRQGARGQ